MAPVPCAIQSYPTNRLANCHREIWGGSWPRRKLWPGQLPPHLCQRDFPRFTAARVSLQSVCQDAQGHRGSDREWLKSRCPGLPRQRDVASSQPLVATGCRKLEAAGCDRLSQARGRWLRQAVVASSRPLAATGCRDLEAACCDSLSQPRGRWLRQAVASSQPVVATGCRKLAMAEIKILGILISATRQRVCRGSAEGLASDRPVSRC